MSREAAITFEHVTFSYRGMGHGKPNLSDLHFTIQKGETLGIIGEIGSGKTTVLNLLMRLYDADQGRVLVDGRDVREYPRAELKEKFGVVFQNDTLFEGTIAENVSLGRELTGEQLQEALFYARASEFVERREEKESESLNIKGANLSGGQKQRLLIARALAARPDILILDDSSSALDYRTDAELRRGIREFLPDTTLVIVAQRVSSVRSADHILVLEDGRAIGYGTHQELLKNCPVYREISQSQMGETGEDEQAVGKEKAGEDERSVGEEEAEANEWAGEKEKNGANERASEKEEAGEDERIVGKEETGEDREVSGNA